MKVATPWPVVVSVLALAVGCTTGGSNFDFDGDGFSDLVDCAPNDPAVHPGVAEVCNDGIDNDCDTWADCADTECILQDPSPCGDDDDSVGDDDSAGDDDTSGDDDSAGDDDTAGDDDAGDDDTSVPGDSDGDGYASTASGGADCDDADATNTPINSSWCDQERQWQNSQLVSSGLSWLDAESHCGTLELGGHTDWRLPTISELRTLARGCPASEAGGACGVADQCLCGQCQSTDCGGCGALAPVPPPQVPCYWPAEFGSQCSRSWSSSIREGTSTSEDRWFFDFSTAEVDQDNMAAALANVRCVRAFSGSGSGDDDDAAGDDDATGDDDTPSGPFTGTVVVGPEVFGSADVGKVSVAAFGSADPDGRAALIYQDLVDSQIGKIVAYDHDGTLAGGPVPLAPCLGVAISNSAAGTLSNGNVAVAFQESGVAAGLKYVVFDRDGNRVVGPEFIANQAVEVAVAGTANGNLAVAYGGYGARMAVIYPTGTVYDFSIGDPTATVLDLSLTTLHGGTNLVMSYVSASFSSNQVWFSIFDQSGSSTPLWGPIFRADGPGASVAVASFDDEYFLLTFGHADPPGGTDGPSGVYQVIRHSIGPPDVVEYPQWGNFAAGATPSELSATSTPDGNVMVVYKESSNEGKLAIFQPTPPVPGAPVVFQAPGSGIAGQNSCALLSTGEVIIGYADYGNGAAPFQGEFVIVD